MTTQLSTLASQFKSLNLRAVIDRANDILIAIKELRVSTECEFVLIKAHLQGINDLENDDLERLSWQMVHTELLIRDMNKDLSEHGDSPCVFTNGNL